MNILLINHYAGSLEYGMEYRPYYLAREWVKMGHKVHILAAGFSHLRMRNPPVTSDFQLTEIDGIDYHWLTTLRYDSNGVKRALSMFQFCAKLYFNAEKIVKMVEPNVVISSSTYPLDTYPAQVIARKAGAILIHEVHDMWPLTLRELGGYSRWHPFIALLQAAENSAYRNSCKIVSLLPNSRDYMIEHGMNEEKFVHIPNGVVLEDWLRPEDVPELHQETICRLRQAGKFLVCYFGGHSTSNALSLFIDSAAYLTRTDVQLVLVGNGVEKKSLMERATQLGLDNVTFLPPVRKKAVPTLLEFVDLIYIGTSSSSLYRFGLSLNKMYDAMMSGKPIVSALCAPGLEVSEYQCGLNVSSGDPKSIAAAIEQLLELDEGKRAEMGMRGRRAVQERFNYSALSAKFNGLFFERTKNENSSH